MADRQPLAHDQPQPQEGRQLRALEVTVQPGGDVEERVLEHVGGVDPALKARIHAQLDHPAQPLPVTLEQVRQRLAVAPRSRSTRWRVSLGSSGITGPLYPLPAQRLDSDTNFLSQA